MKISDLVVDILIKMGITDLFGIPGGVVLDLLDSVAKRKGEIYARLNYHEQASAFAACGFAQASGKLSAAYATRGPGVTNMITAITDSYCESVPVFYFTAHAHISRLKGIRIEADQEFDTVKMLSSVTKYSVRIDRADDVLYELEKAYYFAMTGRPGPVLIDFLTSVLKTDIPLETLRGFDPKEYKGNIQHDNEDIVNCIRQEVSTAKRPVLLIGDGIKQSRTEHYMRTIANQWSIPVLSSRFSADIIPTSEYYFGYIGSHAMRCGNFILSKADMIVCMGNRFMFNPKSQSFGSVAENAKIIRIDIDSTEFLREIPGAVTFCADLKSLMPVFAESSIHWDDTSNWMLTCKEIQDKLSCYDTAFPVDVIATLIQNTRKGTVVTSDVGNNEFWLSRAYTLSGTTNRVLYSKSFGVLGCSVPKAIGAYYACRQTVLCFTGDQGLQMNIQELQFIAQWKLPIIVVVINNKSSGMIRDQQEKYFGSRFESTTADSGYCAPSFEKIAGAYSIKYHLVCSIADVETVKDVFISKEPAMIEIAMKDSNYSIPYLPKGNLLQNLEPEIERNLYYELDRM